MKARLTEERIIRILKEQENGKKVTEIIRENNITEQTFYRWKGKFGGMEVSRQPCEASSTVGGRLVSRQSNSKGCHIKKRLKPAVKRQIATEIQEGYQISERYACRLMQISQNSKRYQPVEQPENQLVTERLISLSDRWKRFRYRQLHIMLLREGFHLNHKLIYRLYKEAGLVLQKRSKKKKYEKRGMPKRTATTPNVRWSMDFVSDRTRGGCVLSRGNPGKNHIVSRNLSSGIPGNYHQPAFAV